jgi:hypothetical protein
MDLNQIFGDAYLIEKPFIIVTQPCHQQNQIKTSVMGLPMVKPCRMSCPYTTRSFRSPYISMLNHTISNWNNATNLSRSEKIFFGKEENKHKKKSFDQPKDYKSSKR